MKHLARNTGAVKWHPYNVKAKFSALNQLASLWARKRFAKYGVASDPIGIPIIFIIIFPIEKKVM